MIGANENILMGGFWGGHRETVKEACEYVLRNYVTEMLMKKRIDTEQTTWFFHAQENPQKYMFIPPHQVDVINFLLFSCGFKI
jgi:molybdopterin synthase catalytic subunit